MHNDPWSNARVPDSGDACDLWDYFRNMAADMAPELEPYFTTTAARDTALANWVAAGNTTRDGLRCWVQGVGAQRYQSGAWVTSASSGLLSLVTGWAPQSGYHTPTWYLSADGWVTLSGAVQRTGSTFALGTGTTFQFANIPTQIQPSATASPGTGWVVVGAGTTNYPCRIHVTNGSSFISVVGMDSGTGNITSGVGIVDFDGVRYHI